MHNNKCAASLCITLTHNISTEFEPFSSTIMYLCRNGNKPYWIQVELESWKKEKLTCAIFLFLHICRCHDRCLCGAFPTGNVGFLGVFFPSLSSSFDKPYLCYSAMFWSANNGVKNSSNGSYILDVTSPGLREYILLLPIISCLELHLNCCLLLQCKQKTECGGNACCPFVYFIITSGAGWG